jgi:ABC-2 type transport system permease protein
MSTASPQPFSDTMTMVWRNILHNLRAPSGVITVIGVPLIFLLLFVYVFGETLGAGLITGGTRDEYLAYITPAILLIAAASATQMIAVWISMDMSKGIIARFRTMAIARSSVLAGHVYGGTILITVSTAALLGFALLLGYRPQADALDWLALAGFVVLVGFALAWLSVAFGLAAKTSSRSGVTICRFATDTCHHRGGRGCP